MCSVAKMQNLQAVVSITYSVRGDTVQNIRSIAHAEDKRIYEFTILMWQMKVKREEKRSSSSTGSQKLSTVLNKY